ncbi:DUF4262 domain-containing protein [Rhodococcus kronopolitis]|uniref:DUF4262 domain-containing protein n=1 Tax=Rhodococcus kronopolitis TaxID=1460226 RepID=A0ABV9FU25_9NOCA
MCDICNGKTPRQARRDLELSIEEYGWALQYVESAVDERGVHPAFCYTVGLTALGCEELVITGRVMEQSAEVLNTLAERIWDGREFTAGERVDAGGLDLCMVPVRECEGWLLTAKRLYGAGNVRAVQAVWADCDGLLPWEGAITSTIVQPLLGLPPGGRIAS